MESGMRLGLTVQNLGMHIGSDTVPVNFRIGVSGEIAGIKGLTVGASYDSNYLDRNIVGVGAEYKIAENLTARAGSYDGKFTAGLGVNYENFQLDYSMNNDDDLGDLSKLSLGYYLSSTEKKTPSESKAPSSKPAAKAESKSAPKEEKKVEKTEEPATETKAETSSRSRSRSKPAESTSKPEPEPETKAAPAEEPKKVEEPAPAPKESKKEQPAEKPAVQAPVVQPEQQTTQAVGAPKSTAKQVIPSLDDLLSGTVIDQPMYKVPQIGEGSYTIIGQ